MIKAGFAAEEHPEVVFPSVVGEARRCSKYFNKELKVEVKTKEYIGDKAMENRWNS
jgi:actin-related protein